MRKLLVALCCAWALSVPAFSASVLVVPFHNASQYQDLNWVGESVADTLANEFGASNEIVYDRSARAEALRRLSLRSDADYTKATLIRLGESLDADYICFGSYDVTLPTPSSPLKEALLQISAQFIDLRKMHDGPDLSETGNLSELWRLEEHLAFESLHYLEPKLTLKVEDFLSPQKAVRIDAKESYTRGLLSTTREQRQKWFLQAAALNPGFAGPAYELGRLYLEEKQYQQVLNWLRKVPSADPRYPVSRFRMGLASYSTGDYATAADIFRDLARSYPLNEVYNNLGVAETAANQPAALDDLRHALEGEPTDSSYLFNLGAALIKKGDPENASKQLQKVLDQNPYDDAAQGLLNGIDAHTSPQALVKPSLLRLKNNFNETAFRQLKAMIQTGK